MNVYQLGALLHDLIVGAPLFQAEYELSKTNRYRFAWVVATQIPRIDASDIDDDLLFLTHRALDKDWNRRSTLRIKDFLDDSSSRQENAFQMLGLFRSAAVPAPHDIQTNRVRLDEISKRIGGAPNQILPQWWGDNHSSSLTRPKW